MCGPIPHPTRIPRRSRTLHTALHASRTRALAVSAAVLAGAAAVSAAQPLGAGEDEETPAQPRLIAEYDGLVPGVTNTLALTFEIDDGWHVYWTGQNDTGFPVTAEFDLPEGHETGEMRWPTPHRHVSNGGILDYIYEGDEATILVPLDVPASAEPGSSVTIRADVEWLVCREACIPGWATVEATFPVLDPAETPRAGDEAGRIAEARRRLPVPLPPNATDVTIRWSGEVLTLTAERPVKTLTFLPHEKGRLVADPLKTAQTDTQELRLTFRDREEDDRAKPVLGVLVLDLGDGARPRRYRIETSPPAETD